MWQTASQILRDEEDKTTLSLVYANMSSDDILIKDLLDHLASQYPSRCVGMAGSCAWHLHAMAWSSS